MMTVPLHERTLARVLRDKAKANGDKPFLTFEGRTYSYADAYTLSSRIAAEPSARIRCRA